MHTRIALVTLLPLHYPGCAVVTVADAAVTVVATTVKVGATVVGTAVDVTAAGVKAVVGSDDDKEKSESLGMGCRKPDRSLSVLQVVEKLTWLVSVAGKPQKQPRRFRKNGIGQIRASVGLSGSWPPPQTRCQSGCHV